MWVDGEGARLRDLSAFEDEDEVLVEGPSQYAAVCSFSELL